MALQQPETMLFNRNCKVTYHHCRNIVGVDHIKTQYIKMLTVVSCVVLGRNFSAVGRNRVRRYGLPVRHNYGGIGSENKVIAVILCKIIYSYSQCGYAQTFDYYILFGVPSEIMLFFVLYPNRVVSSFIFAEW